MASSSIPLMLAKQEAKSQLSPSTLALKTKAMAFHAHTPCMKGCSTLLDLNYCHTTELGESKIMTGNIIQCHNKKDFEVDINHNVKSFTEDEIKRITSNYSTPIGKGGFGEVYRGLDDDYGLVAVKRYIREDLRKEFMEELKKSLGFFKRSLSGSKILSEPSNVRIFTQEELNEITHNVLSGGTSGKVYKGRLEDNTVVAVRIFSDVLEGFEEGFINGGMILSQISHKNIIRLLGYCLDADCPAFVYEYAANGNLSDLLDGHKEFRLGLRVKIAVKTAEALEYLHSSAIGIIRHGYVVPSKILLDDNFMPKLTGFSWARRFIKESKITASDDASSGLYSDPIHDQCVLLKVKTDVYQFGVLLLTLISRKNFVFYADHDHLISEFLSAYGADGRGRAFFDNDIAAHGEDIALLEEIGMLALKCICLEIDQRPTMKEVAEDLRILRRSWTNSWKREAATLI
ncbi:hypothetical protein U9M48_002378 [Paspalum notatum var. saurae]|uniref:Protein kinase domain-containing protein n=1 Tax=Paspalum notatum var. saurae TaxID=547442 RepID=A0AAQ3PQF0_PASNO